MEKEKDDAAEKVAKWLEDQGYPLEMNVAAAFQKAGFSVSISDRYKDFQTNEQREIDVTALAWSYLDKSTALQVCWRIECKLAREKPWVIFVSSIQPEYFLPLNILASRDYKNVLLESFKSSDILDQIKKVALLWPRHIGHGITQAFKAEEDITYKSIMSAVKSSADRVFQLTELSKLETKNKRDYWCIAFPVIVIDGKLYEYFIDIDGENKITEIQSGILFWKDSVTSEQSSFLVYVTTKEGLNQFVDDAKAATNVMMDIFVNFNQNTIRR